MTYVQSNSRHAGRATLIRQAKLLSWLTLGWLTVDSVIAMAAGIAANSVALIGWGVDCAIQGAASLVIIWRFSGARVQSDDAERTAQRVVGVSFFLLAPYIVVMSVTHLLTGNAAEASWIGMGLAATDAILMPLVGRGKQRAGQGLCSTATTGAGRQNILCAYLSVAVLLGLGANALLGWWWADPVAALLVAVVCVQSGVRVCRSSVSTRCS
ncbi:MAG TPA: cation transporter [Actinomycetes bacterium]|nr:cation transporter [Actinomycetes bacterium]